MSGLKPFRIRVYGQKTEASGNEYERTATFDHWLATTSSSVVLRTFRGMCHQWLGG